MKLRVARHTTSLEAIKSFYTKVLGFDELGSFTSHDHYDGLFLGKPNLDWHLEFTISPKAPDHHPDPDDLLVFYCESLEEFAFLENRCRQLGINSIAPENPYWQQNGFTIADPDGFRIVISKPRAT